MNAWLPRSATDTKAPYMDESTNPNALAVISQNRWVAKQSRNTSPVEADAKPDMDFVRFVLTQSDDENAWNSFTISMKIAEICAI